LFLITCSPSSSPSHLATASSPSLPFVVVVVVVVTAAAAAYLVFIPIYLFDTLFIQLKVCRFRSGRSDSEAFAHSHK
jgi:UDP-N-acetylmuramyl pentapeptide phosphotransferase/UDP-N-acetylglucosamine-1-phosphate transferase